MSDYSFMRSGLSDDYNPINAFSIQDLEILLAVFVKNSIKNASRHVKICGRSGVTKKDMEYALKYEVFDFLGNPDVFEEINRIKNAIQSEIEQEEELDDEEDDDEELEDEELDEDEEETGIAEELTDAIVGDNVVPDIEVQEYSQIDPETVDVQDREFLRNYYRYAETWNTWQPETPMEATLYSAINRI